MEVHRVHRAGHGQWGKNLEASVAQSGCRESGAVFSTAPAQPRYLVQGPEIREQLIPLRADLTQAKVKIQLRLSREHHNAPAPKENKKEDIFPPHGIDPADPTRQRGHACRAIAAPSEPVQDQQNRAGPALRRLAFAGACVRALAACPEPFSAVDTVPWVRDAMVRWAAENTGDGAPELHGVCSGIQTNAATTNTLISKFDPFPRRWELGPRSRTGSSPNRRDFLSLRWGGAAARFRYPSG